MRYEGQIYRPPSEADAYILQATVGCSWNHCTYCDMYRSKTFRVRELPQTLADIEEAGQSLGRNVSKVFVADGDALVLDLDHWEAILGACREAFPQLKRVSAYATAMNVNEKHPEELRRLRELGLSLLYMGPETGDDPTFKRIAKGSNFDGHVEAARRAREAGMKISAIFLLGAGGTERSKEHAAGSAKLITEMDPEFVSALTLTVIPGTPIAKMQAQGKFTLPSVTGLLEELRTIVAESSPTDAVFRTNHASNYLPLAGRLPVDRERIVAVLDKALAGGIALRPESARGL
ncbi:MAG: radical SAM protein [Myxococcales bacterium]|nr:radical SAM protein [Deltaproteobacteria bacterium]NNL26056.1 radical SAM protein [Myxococcales bacterium]